MDIKEAFAAALKKSRKASNLTQEDFSNVSSRTYLSALERGLKNPTLDKVSDLANVMGIHPLTLFTLAYLMKRKEKDPTKLLEIIENEIKNL